MLPVPTSTSTLRRAGEIADLWKWVLACKHGATAILNRKREVIGYRSMLVYYNNALNTNTKKRDRSEKTKWILHEYTLPEAHNMSSKGHKKLINNSKLRKSQCDDGRSLVLAEDDLPLEFWVDVNDHNSSSRGSSEAAPDGLDR
ncbi:hypothetical protein Sjap_005536 [Stephania japonica]|uniref:NAC domain-containing protein n=1 Tax=Stephania japonica TaxID=461633 RepID=A0AAP0K485_9MAGN